MQFKTRLRCVVALAVGLTAAAACSDEQPLASASIEPGPVSVLSAVVTVDAREPVRLGATATADDHQVRIPPPAEPASRYELAVVGLRPDTDYVVEVDEVGGELELRTGSLPEDFPPFELEVDPERAAEGFTLLSLKPWAAPGSDIDGGAGPSPRAGGYLAVVDHDGYVVWYHPTELGVLDARQLDDGNFLFTYDEVAVWEVDLLGRPVRELAGRIALDVHPVDLFGRERVTDAAVRMDTDSAHHDAGPSGHGTWLLLSTELRELTGPPQCGEEAEEVTYPVIGDVVVEVDPDTGEVLGEWSMFDVYDPFERPGHELCLEGPLIAPPNFFYNQFGDVDARDWTHGNSVVLDRDRNALIVSLRHLDAVIAIRYADDDRGPAGELLWELSPDGTLPLDGEPSTYQHAAEVLDDGSILVYDNGNARASAPAGGEVPPYSRAVIYEVDDASDDPADWSARQVFEHVLDGDDGRPVFTGFLGDVDGLANGNVLVTHGAISAVDGSLSARIIEVDRDTGEVVFDLRVGRPDAPWTVYRSERIPGFWPEGR